MHGKQLVIGYGYANARGTGHLGLEHEQKEVRDALVLGTNQLKEAGIKPVKAVIRVVPAISVTGLSMLANTRPDILVLSMHGAGEEGLCMVGEDGNLMMVTPEQIMNIFEGTNIPFVVLSACHTFAHAEYMQKAFQNGADGLPRWLMGTSKEVSDPGAKGYARTIAAVCMTPGITIGRAHKQGLAAAESTAKGSKDIIQLYCLDPSETDANKVKLFETDDGTRANGPEDVTLEFLANNDGRVVESERVPLGSSETDEPMQQRGRGSWQQPEGSSQQGGDRGGW